MSLGVTSDGDMMVLNKSFTQGNLLGLSKNWSSKVLKSFQKCKWETIACFFYYYYLNSTNFLLFIK